VDDTSPVDAYGDWPSPYGVEDMAGNVAEWVADWFDPDAYADDPDVDPVGPAEGQLYDDGVGTFVARIARGGNYKLGPNDLEVSARFPEPFDATSNGLGFRCARALE
jgi:formylglycine-generating enzyme required for sulfatase activity